MKSLSLSSSGLTIAFPLLHKALLKNLTSYFHEGSFECFAFSSKYWMIYAMLPLILLNKIIL